MAGGIEAGLGRLVEMVAKAPPWLFVATLAASLAYLAFHRLDTSDAADNRWWSAFVFAVFASAALACQLVEALLQRRTRWLTARSRLKMMAGHAERVAGEVRWARKKHKRRADGTIVIEDRDLCHQLTAFYSRLEAYNVPVPTLDYGSTCFEEQKHLTFLQAMAEHLQYTTYEQLVKVSLANGGEKPATFRKKVIGRWLRAQ